MNLVNRPMCRECPWRKNAPAGWLGAASPEEFVSAMQGNQKMPCHLTVDYDDPDWSEKLEDSNKSQYCIGALKATKALCKRPYDREHCEAIDEVAETNTEEILSPWGEFQDHHNAANIKSWEL